MMKRNRPHALALSLLLLGASSVAGPGCGRDRPGQDAPRQKTIPRWILGPSDMLGSMARSVTGRQAGEPAECREFVRYLAEGTPAPVPHRPVPQHPFMARNPGSNMHCDAYLSDTYPGGGPAGRALTVHSRTQGFGGYGTVAFDRAGRIVAVYSNGRGFQLELMDPVTLEELASQDLPPRPWYFPLRGVAPWKYIGAGMYFYLDDQDRAVVPTTDNTVQVIQTPAPGDGGGFRPVRQYDLSGHVVPMPWHRQDSVAWVLPDWSGDAYWYATTGGMTGTVKRDTGEVAAVRLQGEVIENAFAVGEDGVFLLSDRALYRFGRDRQGRPRADWRTEYERGERAKPGHITRGSGTSVTLMGGADGLAVIADNAEPRVRLVFIRRSDGAVACRTPLFEEGRSGTDLTCVGFEHADGNGDGTGVYSVLVENNWGPHRFPFSHPVPGLTRVDAVRLESGAYRCEQVWASREKSIGGFRLSLGNGLAYMYGKGASCPTTTWHFTALDFRTGETVYRVPTGTGLGYNNWQGSLFLHPDGRAAYSTTIFGLVMMRDGAAAPPAALPAVRAP